MFTFENVQHGMDGAAPLDGILLNMDTVADRLNEHYRGFSQDFYGRRNAWSPRQAELQGLFHMHKHICSMDRGMAPQWPRFKTKTGLAKVSIDYAVKHADLPIVCLDYEPGATGPAKEEGHDWPDAGKPLEDRAGHALVEATAIDDVGMVGWAEVLYRITRSCPFIDMPTLGRILMVPTDWAGQIKGSPLAALWKEADKHGAIARY